METTNSFKRVRSNFGIFSFGTHLSSETLALPVFRMLTRINGNSYRYEVTVGSKQSFVCPPSFPVLSCLAFTALAAFLCPSNRCVSSTCHSTEKERRDDPRLDSTLVLSWRIHATWLPIRHTDRTLASSIRLKGRKKANSGRLDLVPIFNVQGIAHTITLIAPTTLQFFSNPFFFLLFFLP